MQTSADGSSVEVVPPQRLASWLHPGLVTALQAFFNPWSNNCKPIHDHNVPQLGH